VHLVHARVYVCGAPGACGHVGQLGHAAWRGMECIWWMCLYGAAGACEAARLGYVGQLGHGVLGQHASHVWCRIQVNLNNYV
jgi:hypothetical protein